MNLELIKAGYQPVDIKFKYIARYIQTLHEAQMTENEVLFLKWLLTINLEEIKSYLKL